MGYYTDFSLKVEYPNDLSFKVYSKDVNNTQISYGDYLRDLQKYPINHKWYDWKEDMSAISERFPNVTFIMDGVGEEAGDIWRAWIRNGHVVTSEGRIVFDVPPDLEKHLPLIDDEPERQILNERKTLLIKQLEELKALE